MIETFILESSLSMVDKSLSRIQQGFLQSIKTNKRQLRIPTVVHHAALQFSTRTTMALNARTDR